MPPKQSDSLDWSKSSPPIPYSFTDLEQPEHELSETFLPGDQSSQYISSLRQAFSFIFDFTIAQLTQISSGNMAVITSVSLENAIAQPKTGIQALLALILGFYEGGSTEVYLIVQKSAIVSNFIEQISQVFIEEAQICILSLENPPQDQKATHQLSQLLINLIQLLHLLVTSQNISQQFVGDIKTYIEIFNFTSQLLIALSGTQLQQPPQTFMMSNARCFAGSRVICLVRQLLIRILGQTNELQVVDKIINNKMKNQEKNIKLLPAPRFYGFANPICQQIQQLELIQKVDLQYGDMFTDIQPNLKSYWDDENMQQFIDFYDKVQQKRRGMMLQECDIYNSQKSQQIQDLFTTLPSSTIKGSLDGIEQNHAAFVAMKLSADCRTSQIINPNQTPIGSTNSIKYNGQQTKLAQPNEATEVMKNKFQTSYTKQFQYSGRPYLINKAAQNFYESIDINMLGFDNSNLDKSKIVNKFKQIGPLDLQSSILKQKVQIKQLNNRPCESNIIYVLQNINLYSFLHAVSRFGLCSIPNTADVISNRHNIPEPGQPPSNNSVASIRHVREIVLKQASFINYQLIYMAKQFHPSLHRYIAKYYSNIPELYEYQICVISQPLGIYSSTFDQRSKVIGQCLFELFDSQLTTEQSLSDASDILFNQLSDMNINKPLSQFSSSRRMFILNSVFRSLYGTVMHSRKRQTDFNKLYNKISANYVSAIMQSASTPQANVEDENSSSSTMSLSQTINQKKLGKAIGGLADFGINSKKQVLNTLDPLSVFSMIEFLSGQNGSNNPQRQNMACTISCTFPGYQALRVNNLGLLMSFLKFSIHLLPTSSGSENGDYASVFEIPGLQAAREAVIRASYISGVSAKSVDSYRWNKDTVCAGEGERDFQESRSILEVFGQILDMSVISETIKVGYTDFGGSVVDSELGFVGK